MMVAYHRSQSTSLSSSSLPIRSSSSSSRGEVDHDDDDDDEHVPTTTSSTTVMNSNSSSMSHTSHHHPNSNTNTNNSYPYTRHDECSWSQPDDVARYISRLLYGGGGDKTNAGESICTTTTGTTSTTTTTTTLLSQGLTHTQVQYMRRQYGINRVGGPNTSNNVEEEEDILLALMKHETNTSVSTSTTTTTPRHDWATILHRTKRYSRRFVRTTIRPIVQALWGQWQEPLILMLLGSAIVSILLGNPSDAISIALALFIVSMVAAVQEYRSERALEQLQHLVPPTCTVVRNHGTMYTEIPALELVVGDLLLLQTGDRIPADARVVESVALAVDESALTGEPDAISKISTGLFLPTSTSFSHNNHHHPISLSDQRNIVFAGTCVNGGRGRAIVVAVGDHTELGHIATSLSHMTTTPKSPLQIKIDELSQRLAYISTIIIILIAIVGYIMGRPILETLTIAVSLAVAAIPEGLPICVTVTLALGVLRMARQNAIIKKLPVVESLGCTTVIASDKTGTLTQNESTL